jgi:nucleotide-binding universal stress UspA family protein
LVAPDGELLLTHVHGGYPLVAKAETGDYERVIRDDAETLLAQASEQTGIRARILHGSSSVGRGLRELAERESADLVVVGSTRRGPTARCPDVHPSIPRGRERECDGGTYSAACASACCAAASSDCRRGARYRA